jgi:hypothetical protein
MHCVYCGVEYSSEEPCLCMPPVRRLSPAEAPAKVKGAWGEAVKEWSVEAGGERRAFAALSEQT